MEDAVNVIFYHMLREMQASCNFLISKPPANQFHQLMFASTEFRPAAGLQILPDSKLLGRTAEQQ